MNVSTANSPSDPNETDQNNETQIADFWFDPLCPWAWNTSRWAGEVTQVRNVTFRWHIFSLGALNENNKDHHHAHQKVSLWGPARVVAAVAASEDQAAVKNLYDQLGTLIHPGARRDIEAVIPEALAEAGLLADYAAAMNDDSWDDVLREGNQEALSLVGEDVGVPIISVQGHAFFGPVISAVPRGEEAGKLWDGVNLVAAFPGFYELKRSRTQSPTFD